MTDEMPEVETPVAEVGEAPAKKTRGRKKKEVPPPQDVVMETVQPAVDVPEPQELEPEPVAETIQVAEPKPKAKRKPRAPAKPKEKQETVVDVVPLDVPQEPVYQEASVVSPTVQETYAQEQPEVVTKERDWKSLHRIARETRREVKSAQYKRLLEGKKF